MKGNKIEEILKQSFLIKEQVISDIIAVYLKTQNQTWYKLTISDGVSTINVEEKPLLKEDKGVDFQYPISKINNNFFNELGVVINVQEYLWQGLEDESMGFLFTFYNQSYISFFEEDDNMKIKEGKIEDDNIRLKAVIF